MDAHIKNLFDLAMILEDTITVNPDDLLVNLHVVSLFFTKVSLVSTLKVFEPPFFPPP